MQGSAGEKELEAGLRRALSGKRASQAHTLPGRL